MKRTQERNVRLLRVGCYGKAAMENTELIKRVQQALKSAGFDPGPIDGIPGRRTSSAVADFQKAKGLGCANEQDTGDTAQVEEVEHPPGFEIKFPGAIGPKTIAALLAIRSPQKPRMLTLSRDHGLIWRSQRRAFRKTATIAPFRHPNLRLRLGQSPSNR
jgi:peptidoglycan hydrolase-like protein with peptidoglycan-binding domain